MPTRRAVLVGVLLASAVATGALLMELLTVALVVNGTLVVAMGVLMFFNGRNNPATQPGPVSLSPEQRVERVLELNSSILELAGRVRSEQLRLALTRGCELVPEIMSYTRQRDPDNLATTSAQIGTYMSSVHTALTTYVNMQEAPRPDTPRKLFEDGKVLGQFPEFVLKSKAQLEAGDLSVYRANLAVLRPMTTKGIQG